MNPKSASLLCVMLLANCASSADTNDEFDAMAAAIEPPERQIEPPDSGVVDDYVAHAVRHRPELRASLERWRASRARIDAVDELPPLELGYGYYLSRVETRVGPQRHRASIKQRFPWPTAPGQAMEARRAEAAVDGVRHDAELVAIRWQVLDAYWAFWKIDRQLLWHREHDEIVKLLANTVRGRVEVGAASLADVGQAELLVSRTADATARAERQRQDALLRFAYVAGVEPSAVSTPTTEPRVRLPAESEQELVAAATEHPNVRVWAARRDAALAGVDEADAARLPGFGVGVDWIETGPALDPSIDGSGRDAVVGSVGLKLPLFSGEITARTEALEATAASHEASGEAARRDAETALRRALVDIEDSARQVRLYESTLVPQAEAVLGSVQGSYETGQSSVSALLLAQNELLELQLALAAMKAEHERHWARLERWVGRPVASQEAP